MTATLFCEDKAILSESFKKIEESPFSKKYSIDEKEYIESSINKIGTYNKNNSSIGVKTSCTFSKIKGSSREAIISIKTKPDTRISLEIGMDSVIPVYDNRVGSILELTINEIMNSMPRYSLLYSKDTFLSYIAIESISIIKGYPDKDYYYFVDNSRDIYYILDNGLVIKPEYKE